MIEPYSRNVSGHIIKTPVQRKYDQLFIYLKECMLTLRINSISAKHVLFIGESYRSKKKNYKFFVTL